MLAVMILVPKPGEDGACGERQVLLQKGASGLADDGCSNFHGCSLGSHDSKQKMFR